jgi:peptidoglycan/xylan/chitin deacetylase (PgdA/CDA1 family)
MPQATGFQLQTRVQTHKPRLVRLCQAVGVLLIQLLGWGWAAAQTTIQTPNQTLTQASAKIPAPSCKHPLYLTFDTGHMGVAQHISEVLQRQQVRVTFFAAHEATREGDGSMGEHWAPWWREQSALGHVLASHTLDHVYWLRDLPPGRFQVRASSGPAAGQVRVIDAAGYCDEIRASSDRLARMTGTQPLPLFRAPGGKTSPSLLAAARQCGFLHVGWADAGFLGDELPSERYPNEFLLRRALRNIRAGDILMAHLGIWSRRDPWAPEVLEPLIIGLKDKGHCFDTLDRHPAYADWVRTHQTR